MSKKLSGNLGLIVTIMIVITALVATTRTIPELPELPRITVQNPFSGGIPSPPSPSGVHVMRYDANQNYMRYSPISPGDGYAIADELDIYQAAWYDSAIEGMHAKNKKIITYLNALAQPDVFASSGLPNPDFNPDWVLVDSLGNMVASQHYAQLKVYDPMNQDWRDYFYGRVQKFLSTGYDGIWADVAIDAEVPVQFHITAIPINPRTGSLYTDEGWMNDRIDFLNSVKSRFPSALIIANGLWSGNRYFKLHENFQHIIQSVNVDGLFMEGSFASTTGAIWSEADWVKTVDAVVELQINWLSRPGKILVLNSNVRGMASLNGLDVDQAARFVFCSALMGVSVNGQNYVCLHNHMSDPESQALFDVDLGSPISDYEKIGDIYKREFTKVIVYVNPVASAAIAEGISLEGYDGVIISK